MRFDPSQPYAEVTGLPGVAYEQEGRRFSARGAEVTVEWGEDGSATTLAVPEDAAEELPAAGETGFRHLNVKQLKALIETYDQPWVDKETAVRFLEGNS